METYDIKGLSFSYPMQEKKVLSDINLTIDRGTFMTLCGKSGSGKSTLLRQLKTVMAPHGKRTGFIYFGDKDLEFVDERTQAAQIGYVLQSPEDQIVTDKVWHELAFGLESLGYDNSTIRLRVAEMASFFGIQNWFYKNVEELSGGQKQLLNLASIMAMQPTVLILDEPTSQLDPIAATDFIETLKRINHEIGTTIIISEHRLEEIMPLSDRLVVLDDGHIIANDVPRKVGEKLSQMQHTMFCAMSSPMQVYGGVKNNLPCPLTVKEGRKWLDTLIENQIITKEAKLMTQESMPIVDRKSKEEKDIAICFKDVWFKYEKDLPDVIKGLSLEVHRGKLYTIVGGNGTGKTTALFLMNGIHKPYRGKVLINGKNLEKLNDKQRLENHVVLLPQNPQTLFVKNTVSLDLYEMLVHTKLTKEEKLEKIKLVVALTELEDLVDRHPYDLSGGEQQRAALAKVLLLDPQILLVDEPTKGIDSHFKKALAKLFARLTQAGVTIVMVSHDIEFCAEYADVCAMFFDGTIITTNTPRQFFSGNSFYTTAANRMARHIWPQAVTAEDVIKLCQSGH